MVALEALEGLVVVARETSPEDLCELVGDHHKLLFVSKPVGDEPFLSKCLHRLKDSLSPGPGFQLVVEHEFATALEDLEATGVGQPLDTQS